MASPRACRATAPAEAMKQILVVDDEPRIAAICRDYLERAGFKVSVAGNGEDALAMARAKQPDLIVLDLGLPKKDGLEVTRSLRAHSNVPIIMLTARVEETDKLIGLELGADDYLTKPFSPRELVARVEAVLRRTGTTEKTPRVIAGALTIDPERCEVSVDGAPVTLTATELRLLIAMARTPGRVFRRDELARLALGDDFEGLERTIDAHIKNLRRKVGAETIATVFGIGYKLVA